MKKIASHPALHDRPMVGFAYKGAPDTPESVEDATAFLGGKGVNLVRMAGLNLPVPPGFTLPTPWCGLFEKNPEQVLDECVALALEGYARLSEEFGYAPLVSVRSGAPVSMPGMMDTILNVGMTSEALPAWAKRIGTRAALDSRRRLIQMMGATAYGVPSDAFEKELAAVKKAAKVTVDSELPEGSLQDLIGRYLKVFQAAAQKPFPETVEDQLRAAIGAVFKSWRNERADVYRKLNGIPADMGTAVTVQTMVFGNYDDESGSGVLFTRDPNSGAAKLFGEFLPNAQGEDVVAGVRTPLPYAELEAKWPAVAIHIAEICQRLEAVYRDMMDIEFTVQQGKLFMLQCRVGKRSAVARFQIAYDFWKEGVIGKDEALGRITAKDFVEVSRPSVTEPSPKAAFQGLPGNPGVAVGIAVVDSKEAEKRAAAGEKVMLVRYETDPDDIGGMLAAVGVLTKTGGATSHAAVVARAMDKPCVVGCGEIDPNGLEGRKVTICGATGRVWVDQEVVVGDVGASESVTAILSWAADAKGEVVSLDDIPEAPVGYPFRLICAGHWRDEAWFTNQLNRLSSWATVPAGSLIDLTPKAQLLDPCDIETSMICSGTVADDLVDPWVPAALTGDDLKAKECLSNVFVVLPLGASETELMPHVSRARTATQVQHLMAPGPVSLSDSLRSAIGNPDAVQALLVLLGEKWGVSLVKKGSPLGAALFDGGARSAA